jgi:hypothetical protein
MKVNELSNEEVKKLFAFVRSKYVYFIDVQHELVDHLACDIEELQTEDKNLSFDKALKKVYAKYPITGFTNLKAARVKAMREYWRHIHWQYIKEYFTLPKVLISIMLFWSFYKLFLLFEGKAAIPFFTLGMIISIYNSIWLNKRFNTKENNKYLVISSFIGFFGGIYFLPIMIGSTFGDGITMANYSLNTVVGLTIVATYMTLILHASFYYFPERLESDLKNKYPYIQL